MKQFFYYQLGELKQFKPVSLSPFTFIIGIIYSLLNIYLRDYLIFANTINSGAASMNKAKALVSKLNSKQIK